MLLKSIGSPVEENDADIRSQFEQRLLDGMSVVAGRGEYRHPQIMQDLDWSSVKTSEFIDIVWLLIKSKKNIIITMNSLLIGWSLASNI